jgi:hypothetical protein
MLKLHEDWVPAFAGTNGGNGEAGKSEGKTHEVIFPKRSQV